MTSSPQTALAPARIIAPAIRQRLQERLNQARKLSVAQPCPHGQIDELLCECVIVDPGSTVYIGALLHHLRRRDRPRRTEFIPFWRRIFLSGKRNEFRSTLRQAAETQNWDQVLTLAPPALCLHPQSVEILRHLAAACAALEHEQAELCYLQAAAAFAPADAETQRQLARALTRQGLFDDAAIAWKRLADMLPEDEECRQTIKILCESESLPAYSLLDDAEACEIQGATERGTATREQIHKLFEHLRWRQRFSDAQKLLDYAIARFGRRLTLLDCGEKLTMDQSRWRVKVARRLAAFREEYRSCVSRAEDECARVHLQIYQQRSDRRPGDVRLRLELGRSLVFAGIYSEAVKTLEPIVQIGALRAEAIAELAVAWFGLRQLEKMETCIQDVNRLTNIEANVELLADLFDRLKECAVAESDFAAGAQFRDRKREFLAGRTGSDTC